LVSVLKYPIKLRCATDNTVFVVEQTKTEILTLRYLQSQTKQGLKSTTSEEHITKMRNSKVFVVECECVEIIDSKKPKK